MTARAYFAPDIPHKIGKRSSNLSDRFRYRAVGFSWFKRGFLVGFATLFSVSAAAQHKYDGSLGTLPQNQNQGFTYSGDTNVNGTNPSPYVSSGLLEENTTAGAQYWDVPSDPSIDFSQHVVLEATLHVISSNYIPNIGTGTREGYYLAIRDQYGSYTVGLADAGFNINSVGVPNQALTPYPIAGAFHTYRLEITNEVATFSIDGVVQASGIPPGNHENIVEGVIFGGLAGSSRSVTELKSFFYSTSCSVKAGDVTRSIGDLDPISQMGSSMDAAFTPSAGLTATAAACGFERFDWQQTVDVLPCPSSFYAANPAVTGSQNVCLDGSLTAPPKFNDPLPGGYTYSESQMPPYLAAYPFVYNPADVPGDPSDILAGCAKTDENGICALSITSSPTSPVCIGCDVTLNFSDSPADSSLLLAALDGTGSFVAFTTSLVGVKQGNVASPPIIASDTGQPITWSWKSDYDGFSGGVSRLSNNHPVDPGSGTGGVTITSIDGVAQTPPIVRCMASPQTDWSVDGNTVSITILGSVTAGTSVLAVGGTSYAVFDRRGRVQSNGGITLDTGGHYSLNVSIVAKRNRPDRDDGEHSEDSKEGMYSILVDGKDALGNVGSCSSVVNLRKHQRHIPEGDHH